MSAIILEHLNVGLVDEFSITLAPVLFASGTRPFEGVDASRVALEPTRSEPSSRVTRLTYVVNPRKSSLCPTTRRPGRPNGRPAPATSGRTAGRTTYCSASRPC